MWEETGTADVFAGGVNVEIVFEHQVVLDADEIVEMGSLGEVDFNYPFEAMARWGCKQELGLEVVIVYEMLAHLFEVFEVVEIET